jgi:hypothetical protein
MLRRVPAGWGKGRSTLVERIGLAHGDAMTVETVNQARRALADEGFAEDLVVEGSRLRVASSEQSYAPSDVVVQRVIRLRGISTPEQEAVLFGLATRDEEPLGTYVPAYRPAMASEDAAMVEQLHQKVMPEDEIRAHAKHDHVAAVFDSRATAQKAVDELRQLGWGSDRMGLAVREGSSRAFERDAEGEALHDTGVGVGVGAALGFLAGMSVAAIALLPGGIVGIGGILAAGAGTGVGGAMLGGYLGEAMGDRAFSEREELLETHLEPGQVLVAVCSHGHPSMVQDVMERHGGELLLRQRQP